MNTLQLHLPLCDANTDKSLLEVSIIFHLKAFVEGCAPIISSMAANYVLSMEFFCLYRVSMFRRGCFLADLEWILGQHKSSTS